MTADGASAGGARARDYTTLDYEVADRIATITIDNPPSRNGFNGTMRDDLIAAAHRADNDDDVRAVILTGRGKFFCPGADLSGGGSTFDFKAQNHAEADGENEGVDDARPTVAGFRRDGGGQVALAFASLRKPIISAINGAAVGIGATMTLPTDMRIASTDARFGFVFAHRGLVPEAASSWFLPRIVGITQALDWVYTGRVFDAEEARAGGLVSRVVAPEDLQATAREMALAIVNRASAVSLGASRQLLWSMLTAASPWDAHQQDSRLIFELGQRADAREGVESFLEKRPPQFPGTVPADYPDFLPPFPDKDRIE